MLPFAGRRDPRGPPELEDATPWGPALGLTLAAQRDCTTIAPMPGLTREERWRAAREQREASAHQHPFLAEATLESADLVVTNGRDEEGLVLVAFPGAIDRMAIPISEFFDAVGMPSHQIVIRRLALPYLQHAIGADLIAAADWMNQLIAGRPTLFVGHSLGAFPALLLASMCQVDTVLAVNPTTSLLPANLEAWQDRRYAVIPEAPSVPHQHCDVPAMWEAHGSVRTHVHYSYRDAPHRGHAEHIAEFDSVELTPYYQYQPMYELLRTGKLGPLIDGLLSDTAAAAVARFSEARPPVT
jgi:hypothetical protein